jgi:hypothetical protein
VTLTASFKVVQGAVLRIHGVDVASHSPALPVVEANSGGLVHLAHATLRDGRDGVYLASGARLLSQSSRLVNNSRGVFEGFRCAMQLQGGNTFDGNLFHMVLLGNPSPDRMEELTGGRLGSINNSTNDCCFAASERTRGDFAFKYNPVLDQYADVYKDGVPVVLTEQESTANLVDPTW